MGIEKENLLDLALNPNYFAYDIRFTREKLEEALQGMAEGWEIEGRAKYTGRRPLITIQKVGDEIIIRPIEKNCGLSWE